MTAKKAQTSTMILLVVPLGFSMGTELLKTIPHSSHTDFPMVKVGPPGSGRQDTEPVTVKTSGRAFDDRYRPRDEKAADWSSPSIKDTMIAGLLII